MSGPEQRLPAPVELVRLNRINAEFGFAAVRLPGVMLHGIAVRQAPDGDLRITCPSTADRTGKRWPSFSLQPGTREAVETAIRACWDRTAGGAA